MTPATPLYRLIKAERVRQRQALVLAGACGIVLAAASSALLGVSGWFITGAAAAGLSGAALAFNFMLPSAGIRLFAILRTAGRYGERLAGHQAALRGLARIRPALFRSLAAAPVAQALALSTGEASARLVQDVDAVETLFVRISNRWSAGAGLVCGVLLTCLASVEAAGFLASLFALQVGAGWVIATRFSRRPAQRVQQSVGRMKDVYASLAAAAPELVCYDLQDWAGARINEQSRALGKARRELVSAQGWQSALAACLTGLAAMTTLLLAHKAPLPIAALATLVAVVTMEGSGGLIRAFDQDGAVEEAARRLNPILDHDRSAQPMMDCTCRPFLCLTTAGGRIHLSPGERLAIVGRSGCGKTSLIERIMRLRAAPRGLAWIDSFDVADISDSRARRMFAYAPQEPTLLSATVRENLLLAAPESTDGQLWNALFDAKLDAKIMSLPARLDGWLGEGGERLSGGERRRLALARAYLRPAPWLVLDEPTEGLDEATEEEVLERLHRRLSRTKQGLLMISHKPAALNLCDRILRLDEPVPVDALTAA